MFVRHQVKDYASWREIYDAAEALRLEHGVRASGVYRTVGNPNEVTVWHDFDSAKAANAFAGQPELRDGMAKAGVLVAPTVWVTEDAG
jgi:hypothetical protein